jgi:hypothetical protein
VVVLAEGYYLVGFGTRLYWRWRENLEQIRRSLPDDITKNDNNDKVD